MAKEPKTKKLSIIVPAELLDEIAEMVPQREMNEFLTEAARQYLMRLRQQYEIQKGFGAWTDERHPELADTQDTIEYVETLRRDNRARLGRLINDEH